MGIVVQHKPRVVKAFVLFLLLLVGLYTASVALFGSPANRALSQAAADGDVAGVEAALAHGADVNTWVDDDSPTPLIMAALNNHVEVARVLIAHGADVNKVSGENAEERPLDATSDPVFVKLLIAHGGKHAPQTHAPPR